MKPPKLLRTVAFSILTFLFAVAMGVSTSMAQVYITPDGDDAAGTGTSTNPYETLVKAIAEASDGETIFIGGGTYTEGGAQVIDTGNDHTFTTFEHAGTSTATFTDNYTFQGGTEITGNLSDETLEFTGVVTIDDATLNFNGQYLSVDALTITTNGTFNASGSSFSPGGDLNVAGTLALSSGTLLRLTGQNVQGTGDIGVGGQISISGGTVTVAAATTFAGDLLLNASGTLDLGAQTLTLLGDFENIQGSTFTGGTGTLSFAGEAAQEFYPRQLVLNDFEVTGANTVLTIRTTLNVAGDVTIGADAHVNLGQSGDAAVHIRMDGAGAPTFENQGGYTTPTNVAGFIIAEQAFNIQGSGVFGNLDVRNASVTATGNVNFSGELIVRDGVALVLGANTLTFTDDFVAVSSVSIIGSGDVTGTAFAVDGDALYDLDIDADVAHAATQEIAAAGVRNLTIDADGNTVTYAGPAFEVVGTVTLAAGTTLNPGAVNITLSTASLDHTIGGTIADGALVVTGSSVEVNGTADDESDINNLVVDASGSFSSTNLKAINDITIDDGTASITLNENAGTANDVTVNAGSLALNMGDDGRSVNSVTLDAGDLSLGSELTVNTTTDQANGDLSLGANDYMSTGVYTRAGTGAITASSGTLVLNANLDNSDNSSNDLSVVNLEVAAGLTVTTSQDAGQDQTLTVTGDFTHTAGVLTLTDVDLVVSGSTYNYVAGSVGGTGSVVLQGLNMIIDEANAANNPQFANLEVDGNLNLVQGGEDQDQSRTVTVTTEFVHTSGAINFGAGDAEAADNNLNVAGAFTRTGGTYVADDGVLTFNGATAFTPGSNFSIQNVVINGGDVTTQSPFTPFTISETFEFGSSGNLVLDDDDEVIFADGATITRTGAATISDVPDFGTGINVMYTAALTADNELPSTVADLGIGAAVTIPAGFGDLTVDGTLTLDDVLTFTDADDLIITANASIVENVVNSVVTGGTIVLPSVVESLTLGFDDGIGGPEPETSSEFFGDVEYNNLIISGTGDIAFTAAVDELAANLTVDGDLALGVDIEINGDLSVGDTGTFDFAGFNVNLLGGLSLDDTFTLANATGNLTFSGSEDVDLTLIDTDWTVPATLGFILDRTGTITLSGGNLDFTNIDLQLNDGVLATDSDSDVILAHNGIADADQGFTRGDGLVAGNVTKSIVTDGGAPAIYERVVFPVGSDASTYRPLTFRFAEGSDGDHDFDLTVSHTNSSPGGLEGLPAGSAVKYPDFYWRVESDLTVPLAPDYEYQVYGEAEGYDIDGLGFTMDDVTLIRRAAGSATINQWNETATDYDNELTEDDLPIVRGLNTTQLIRTQPRLLTFGIPATLREENPLGEIAVNVEQDRVIDVSGIFEGQTGEVTYTATSADAATAEASVSGSDLTLSGVAVGSTTVTVTAEDETGDSATSEFDVTVNEMLASTLVDHTANIDQEYKRSLNDWFSGGSGEFAYSVSNVHDSVSVPAIVGANNDSLEIDLVSMGVDTITVQAVDTLASDTLTVEFALTIGGAFATAGSIDDQELRAADTFNQDAQTFSVDTLASFFAGGSTPIMYSVTSSADDTASVMVAGDTLTVTAVVPSTDPDPVTITVTAEDASGATAVQTFMVTVNPAFGDVNADGMVNSSDASQILSAAIEEVTFTSAQEGAADVNEDGNINSFDASVTFRYFLEDITELPFSSSAKVEQALLAYGDSESGEGTMSVPLRIEGSSVYAVDFVGSFDASAASLESLEFAGLPDDWMVIKSITDEGSVKFALAGATPISSRQFATLTFSITDEYAETSFSGKGFANNSEYELAELSLRETPQEFALEQNYPNPFNPTTTVSYKLPASADVTIELYSINGQKVQTLVSKRQEAGSYKVNVDGSQMASGVYIYRIQAKSNDKSFTTTRKMTLIK